MVFFLKNDIEQYNIPEFMLKSISKILKDGENQTHFTFHESKPQMNVKTSYFPNRKKMIYFCN